MERVVGHEERVSEDEGEDGEEREREEGGGTEEEGGEERLLVGRMRFDADADREDESGSSPWRSQSESRHVGEVVETEPTEITPLLPQQRDTDVEPSQNPTLVRIQNRTRTKVEWWMIPEIILVVPLPVILLSHILVMLIDAMGQSVIDGGPVWLG